MLEEGAFVWISRTLRQNFHVNLMVVEESPARRCASRAVSENEGGYVLKLHSVTPTCLSSTYSLVATGFCSKHRLPTTCMSFIVVVIYYLWFAAPVEIRP